MPTPTLAARVAAIPDLTRDARQRLEDLVADGVQVYAYDAATVVLWIGQYGADYESRWTVPAWNACVAGRHLANVETPCQCRYCQKRRWEMANLRYSIMEGEKLLAKDDTPAKVREGLPALLASLRAQLADLEAQAEEASR